MWFFYLVYSVFVFSDAPANCQKIINELVADLPHLKGDLLNASTSVEAAQRALSQQIINNPAEPRLHNSYGDLLAANGDHLKAAQAYAKAASYSLGSPGKKAEYLGKQADALAAAGKIDEADALLAKFARETNPNVKPSTALYRACCDGGGQLPPKSFLRMLDKDGGDWGVVQPVVAALQNSRPEASARILRNHIQRAGYEKADKDAISQMTTLLERQGKHAEAREFVTEVMNAGRDPVLMRLKRAQLSSNRLVPGTGDFNSLLKVRDIPSNNTHLRQGLADVEKVLAQKPNNKSAIMLKSRLSFLAGDFETAFQTANRLLKADRNNPAIVAHGVKVAVARSLRKGNKPNYEALLKGMGDLKDPRVLFEKAKIHALQGNLREAQVSLNQIVSNPKMTTPHVPTLGLLFSTLSKNSDYYRAVVERFKDSPQIIREADEMAEKFRASTFWNNMAHSPAVNSFWDNVHLNRAPVNSSAAREVVPTRSRASGLNGN